MYFCVMVELTPLARVLATQGRTQVWLAIQLSASLGRAVYKQEISAWVRGLHVPEPQTREAIAGVLGVPESALFAHDAPREKAA